MKSIIQIYILLLAGLFMSGNANAVSWKPECDSGQTLQKPGSDLYRCKVRNGNTTQFRRANCPFQTPNLRRHTLNRYNYSCGLNTGVIGELWNNFACPTGWQRVRNANNVNRTCRRTVPRYRYVEPHFKQMS